MSANLVLFPLDVSGWTKSPRFQTDITKGRNGQESRNRVWQDPLLVFNAAFAVKTVADIETLHRFFLACGGREKSFLVKDWADFQVDEWTEFSGVDGVETEFQLFKNYTYSGIGTYTRNITKPKLNAVTIRHNEVTVDPADYTVDLATGIVTFDTAPTNGHTYDFQISEFYVPSRFDIDELPVEMLMYLIASDDGLANVPDVPLLEVRGE